MNAILISVVIGAVVAVLAAWLMAMPVFWSIAVALPITAVTAMALMALGVAAPSWQALPTPDETLTMHQASSLSSRLAEAAKDPGRFRTRVQPRLRRLAADTLRRKGISLGDDRAREVLGAELHTLITKRDAQLPSPDRLAELLGRLEGK
ncbi:hypothetical protein [Kibdelosporangium aridum]|uniref:hypothetical protein n=1 Tax=Kibdelosporangium aridum TaxID=2030 RepID=UPI000F79827A|nr:hypothetical protein [Kibdelosporangium aridum]